MAETTWEEFVVEAGLDVSGFDLLKDQAYIRKVGKEWCIFSESGKRLGCEKTKPAAERRLKQIEYFRDQKKGGQDKASFYCYCPECGAYFYTPRRCDQSLCPVCHDPDRDNIEVIGEF